MEAFDIRTQFAKRKASGQRGSILFPLLILSAIVAAVGVFSISATSRSLNSYGVSQVSQIQTSATQVILATVLSNSSICAGNVAVTTAPDGSKAFSFNSASGFLSVGSILPNGLRVTGLSVTPISTDPDGTIHDQFNIAVTNRPLGQNGGVAVAGDGFIDRVESANIAYKLDMSSRMTSCSAEVSRSSACQEFGYDYDSVTNRCKVCEALGGTWMVPLTGAAYCSLPQTGSP